MMAVITKAMGAFLVLVVLLMPYYVVNTNIEELTQNVQEKMDKVKSQSHTTLENIKQALAQAGKGRLTDQEIDALEAQIKQLETDLAAAEAEVDRLNSKVKQQASQIVRLQKEVEQLKKEVEELKKHQGDPPLVISQLTWSGCVGTRFTPLIRVVDQNGDTLQFLSRALSRGGNNTFATVQTAWKLDDEGGVSRSSLPIGEEQKTIDVLFLRLNGVMTDHTICHVKAEVFVKNLTYPLGTFDIEDETVGFLGRVKATKNSIEPGALGDRDIADTLSALSTSPCEDLTCFSKDKPGTESETNAAFANYLAKELVPENVAKELAAAVAASRMSPAAAFRWAQLVLDLQNAPTEQSAFDVPSEFFDLIAAKGAPPSVREAAQYRASRDEAALNSTIKKLKAWPDAVDPTLFPFAEDLRKSGMPTELVNAFSKAIAEKSLTADDARRWAELLTKANIAGPRKYAALMIDILQTPKISEVRGGLAAPLANELARAVAEGKATREEVLTLMGVQAQSAAGKPQFKTIGPSPQSIPTPGNNNGHINPSLEPLVASGAMSETAAAAWTQALLHGLMDKEIKLVTAKSAIQAATKLPDALVDLLARQYSEGTMTMEQIKKLQEELSK